MASSNRLSHLSDRELICRLNDLVRREREATLAVLLHLNEVERRRLYTKLGYASLFEYCIERLGYSRSATGRRIQVARCLRLYPDIMGHLEKGDLTLTTLSLLAPVLTPQNRRELLEKARGRSEREVDVLVAPLRPLVPRRNRVRPVCIPVPRIARTDGSPPSATTHPLDENPSLVKSVITPGAGTGVLSTPSQDDTCKTTSPETATAGSLLEAAAPSRPVDRTGDGDSAFTLAPGFEICFTVTPEFMKKYEAARALLSNRMSKTQFEDVFESLIDEFLEKHAPEKRIERREARRLAHGHGKPSPVETAKQTRDEARARERASVPATQPSRPDNSCRPAPPEHRSDSGPRALEDCSATSVPAGTGAAGRFGPDAPGTRSDERSRHISAAVRDQVFARDQGRCTYVGVNGRRCQSTHHLQIDHIVPYSRGGTNALSNLRLLCGTHNELEARRLMGDRLIENRIGARAQNELRSTT